MAAVVVDNLSHAFGQGEMRREVLQNISFSIEPGEVVLLTGPSGCGKTTLLTLIGALRTVQQGQVSVLGQSLDGAGRRRRQQVRRRIGMIFQGHNLLRCLTAEQNVQMGADLLPDLSYRARRDEARQWLRAVGLEDHMAKVPMTCPEDKSNGSPLPVPLPPTPVFFLLMNPPLPWTAVRAGRWWSCFADWLVNNPARC